jgi:hypothetical protein
MKTIQKTAFLLLVTVGLISCKNEPKDTKKESISTHEKQSNSELTFNDARTSEQFQHYIHIKTALVNSDVNEARSGATMLLENTDDANFRSMVSKIVEADDIEIQRTVFSDITEQMTTIVNATISNGEIYQQFCPMAFNNKGGYWLSTEKEILNPYYGEKMLKCGKVTETIE